MRRSRPKSFAYSPTADEDAARLVLSSLQDTNDLDYGPIVTNFSILDSLTTSGQPVGDAIPEPNALWLLLTMMLPLGALVRRTGPPPADGAACPSG